MDPDWIDVTAAWECIEQRAPRMAEESCGLEQACGRVLSQSVGADRDFPAFDRSAMDGFAVRAAELDGATESTPVPLRVVGEATPGTSGPVASQPGTTVRIMTGAAVPAGWDTVIPVELTSGFDRNPVNMHKQLAPGQHIVGRATERSSGAAVYEVGRRLSSADVGGLAMVGCVQPRVFKRPVVAILATGNELVDPSISPGPLHIRNSNSSMLHAQLLHHVDRLDHLGVAPDNAAALRERLRAGLGADLLVVTGGVSAGAYDFVEDILAELGVSIHFRRVALQPGKPVTFGVHARGCVLALPGNPVSAWTTLRLFGIPLLLRMQGAQSTRPIFETLTAAFEWHRKNPKWILFPGQRLDGQVAKAPYGGSGDLLAFSQADGQVVLPPAVERIVPGQPVLFWPAR